MSDESIELPEGWEWTRLSELATLINGDRGRNYPSKDDFVESGVPFVNAGHLQGGKIHLSEMNYITEKRFSILGGAKVEPNDILYCLRGSLGKVAIVKSLTRGAIASSLVLIRSSEYSESHYIFNFLISPLGKDEIRKFDNGSAQPNLSAKSLGEYAIPLPPLNEQRRIVEAIDQLRDRSQKARSALSAVPTLCNKFRQSVLAAAFRGDLTADWREQNPDVEPASVLLERIRLERQYRWTKETSKPAKYKEPALLDSEPLPELPCKWTWANLDQLLFSLRNGLPKPPAEEKPGIPILRISAVRSREINLNDIRFYRLDKSENVETYFLSKGDLLFTRYNGSRAFVGVCGMVQQLDGDLLYPDKLIRGQLVNQALCLPEYIELACNVGTSRKFIDSHIKTSAGQHGIAGGDVKLTPVPLPPVAEQQLIVDRIKQQFSSLQKLIFQMKSCESNFQILDRSILAKAFRGELVEQDPNDEPASILLRRIQAERQINSSKPAKNRKLKATPKPDSQQLDLLP